MGSFAKTPKTGVEEYQGVIFTNKQGLTAPSFPFLTIRYVDNRYIIFPEERIEDPSIQTLAQEDFYQHPVELETVTNNESLGFIVDSQIRTIEYKLPEPWQIRDFASAGSLRLRLSGLQSRCHLISRYTYPSTDCPVRIHSLIQLYIAKGLQSSDCYKAIRKLTTEFAESVVFVKVFFGQSAVVRESHSVPKSICFMLYLQTSRGDPWFFQCYQDPTLYSSLLCTRFCSHALGSAVTQ